MLLQGYSTSPKKFSFKIAILGDKSVGISALFRTLIEKSFREDYSSVIGVSILNKTFELADNIHVTLNLWLLEGGDLFKNIRKTYLEATSAAILVYDVSRPDTFENIKKFLEELSKYMKNNNRFSIMLIGNKVDLERKVTFEQAKNFAIKRNIAYLETSALLRNNLEIALRALCNNFVYGSDWLKENFFYKQTVYKPKVFQIKSLKLEKFKEIATCSSVDWSKRLFEEKKKLEQLLNFYKGANTKLSLIRAEFDELNTRLVNCTFQFMSLKTQAPTLIDFKIRLPLRYPLIPPKASDFSSFKFIEQHHDFKRWDEDDPAFKGFRFACLGKLESRWQKDGSVGVAHYIQMLFYYAAFEHFTFRI